MTWNYSVTLNDSSSAGGSAEASLVYDLEQALNVWQRYILGNGTLVVQLNILPTTVGRADGGPTSSYNVGTNGGLAVYEPSSQYELTTGQHVAGTTSDITINIDPGYFQYIDMDYGLTYASQVPANVINPIDVFLHELMHGFGMTGWYNQSGQLPGAYESTFDTLIQKSGMGAYFVGANAEAAYGGPVPLTTNSTTQNYYHFGNQQSDLYATPSTVKDPLTLDLMNGIVFFSDYQYAISNLDIGILKDLGYSIRTTPVVTAGDQAAGRNQVFAASSLFSVNMAAGDSVTEYSFWDSNGNGHWTVGGTVQGTKTEIDISASQLAQTSYQAGPGADTLWVRAFDGYLWSDWKSFVISPADHAPVVTAANVTVPYTQLAATGSSLFSASDSDGDTITKYGLWDTEGHGYWMIGGVAQATDAEIDVSAASLSQVSYVFGTAPDTLWVRAYDGYLWGAWVPFTATPGPNHAPVVSASDATATHGQDIAASHLFSVNDADNDTITAYQLWDSTSDPASGHWVVGGVAQAAGIAINVSPAQLTSTSFQSGSGSDDLWARAFDGITWGAWKEFHVNAPLDHAPVVTAADFHATVLNQNVAATSLFSVADADGDSITQYQVWDSTSSAGSGHWSIGGVAQPASTAINVSPAQLAGTTFQGGTVTDDLWVRANDGMMWSAWQEFHFIV